MNELQPPCSDTRMASDPQMRVADHHAGPVAVTGFFRQHSRSLFAMTAQTSRCTRVGVRMCGSANIVVAGSRGEGHEDIQKQWLTKVNWRGLSTEQKRSKKQAKRKVGRDPIEIRKQQSTSLERTPISQSRGYPGENLQIRTILSLPPVARTHARGLWSTEQTGAVETLASEWLG